MNDSPPIITTRRDFLKQGAAATAGAALLASAHSGVHAQGTDEIRFALIGCGGRGSGAAGQILNAEGNIKLIAVADVFPEKAQACVDRLKKRHKDKVQVTPETTFSGLDAYKKAIDSGINLIVIATPPGFRPLHFEYAVQKGVNVFMEKPVGTDAPGIRRLMAANEVAKQKGLLVAVGLQRRHQQNYIQTMQRVHDGAIGDIHLVRVYWNGAGIWNRPPKEGWTEMQHQLNNWYHFIWLCGDQICEQHVHNLDVGNWFMQGHPVEANGMGGGEVRRDRTQTQIFDHSFIEFTFENGAKMYSQCRQIPRCWRYVSEAAHGSKGIATPGKISGENEWRFDSRKARKTGGHQQEQYDLVAALLKGDTYNEADYAATSTFTAIFGRMAVYSGKVLKWDDALVKGRALAPGIDDYTIDSTPPVVKDENGLYPAPVPGKYNPFSA